MTENTVPARMENEGTSKVTGDKTVMANIELITEVNVTESMMQAKKPGTSAASGVLGDKTVMENVELGTVQNVMKGPELIWYLATKYKIGPRDMCSLALKKLFRGR